MASSSVTTPLVVDITNRARPKFKNHPYNLLEGDTKGAFSSILYGVLHVEDIRAYIHCDFKELESAKMMKLYARHMIDDMRNLKLEFNSLQHKGFIQFINFLVFDKPEWARYILSRVHGELIWLDKLHKITKQEIKAIICLNEIDEVPSLRNIKNQTVMEATSSKHDGRSMTINDIIEYDIKFVSMVNGLQGLPIQERQISIRYGHLCCLSNSQGRQVI